MKELIATSKALEEEVATLREHEELSKSKMASLEAALQAADVDHGARHRQAESDAAKQREDMKYARALVLRYLELEDQHEALFPALASAFQFTQQEVTRIQLSQQRHARENSLWGLTSGIGSRLVEAAREVVHEVRGPSDPVS